VKKIPLTQNKYAIVDDEYFAYLMQWKWYFNRGYAVRNVSVCNNMRGQIYMHRFINKTPPELLTDHMNMDTLDNRKHNLRNATRGQNKRNSGKQKNNKSGFKGVSWNDHSNKWLVYISCGGKRVNLGSFNDPIDAAETYDIAAYHLHGEFAKLNF